MFLNGFGFDEATITFNLERVNATNDFVSGTYQEATLFNSCGGGFLFAVSISQSQNATLDMTSTDCNFLSNVVDLSNSVAVATPGSGVSTGYNVLGGCCVVHPCFISVCSCSSFFFCWLLLFVSLSTQLLCLAMWPLVERRFPHSTCSVLSSATTSPLRKMRTVVAL